MLWIKSGWKEVQGMVDVVGLMVSVVVSFTEGEIMVEELT
jgi:hypothetical protein